MPSKTSPDHRYPLRVPFLSTNQTNHVTSYNIVSALTTDLAQTTTKHWVNPHGLTVIQYLNTRTGKAAGQLIYIPKQNLIQGWADIEYSWVFSDLCDEAGVHHIIEECDVLGEAE